MLTERKTLILKRENPQNPQFQVKKQRKMLKTAKLLPYFMIMLSRAHYAFSAFYAFFLLEKSRFWGFQMYSIRIYPAFQGGKCIMLNSAYSAPGLPC